MQTATVSPVIASTSGAAPASGARTITMGRNRLNSIENWVKPPKPSKSRGLHAERALAEHGERVQSESRPSEEGAAPRPVSQFVRTVTLAAHR